MPRHVPFPRGITLALALLLFTLAACQGTEPDAGRHPLERDSAGVHIVTYPPLAAWAAPMRLVEEVRIGGVEGEEALLFSEIVGGKIAGDGSIIVADRQSQEVRQFSSAGAFLKSHGREGEGPGEYQYIVGMADCRPTGFTVLDIGDVMSIYDENGDFVEEAPVRLSDQSTPYQFACHPEGRLAVTGWGSAFDRKPGLHVARAHLRILSPDGSEVTDLGERIASERWVTANGSRPHPAGRETNFGFLGSELIVTDGSFFGFERWSLDGVLREIVRVDVDPPDVDSLAAAYLDRTLEGAPNEAVRRRRRSSVEAMEWPEQSAYFTDLVTADAHVLVQEVSSDENGRWFLFAADNTPLGYLPLPPGAALLDMTSDRVLVAESMELDVPQAVLYSIHR